MGVCISKKRHIHTHIIPYDYYTPRTRLDHETQPPPVRKKKNRDRVNRDIYIYIYMCVCVCMYIYIYTYTHTYYVGMITIPSNAFSPHDPASTYAKEKEEQRSS